MPAAASIGDRAREPAALWVLALSVIGGALYFWRIGAQGLWLDEAVTALRVTRPLEVIWRADPFIGPFHEVLLHFWVRLTGTSEVGLRSLSALFAVASIPLLYLLARRLTAPRVALVAAALFAVSPFTIFFAQEARPYALLMLLTIGAMLAFERAMRTRTWAAWLALAILNAALLYTHFYAMFVLLVQAGGVRLLRADAERTAASPFRPWLLSLLASLALFVPRLPAVIFAASHPGAGHHALAWAKVPFTFLVFAVGYNAMPMNADTRADYLAAIVPEWPFLAAVVIGFGCAVILGIRTADRDTRGRFLFWWCFLPTAIVLVLAPSIPAVAAERYFVITFPAFAMLIALGLARPTWSSRVAGVIVIAVIAIALYRYYLRPDHYGWKDHWPQVVALLERERQPGDGIVLFPAACTAPGFRYYATRTLIKSAIGFPNRASDAEMERRLARFRRIWLIESLSPALPAYSPPLARLRAEMVAIKTARFRWGDGQRVTLFSPARPGTRQALDED